MKYRGLTFDKEKQAYKWVYGMPSYGFETEEITEIGTPDGEFYDIDPETLGEETEYKDRVGKRMYTGDIVISRINNEIREFIVERATIDREDSRMSRKVRLSGVIVFCWTAPDGIIHKFLPHVNTTGIGAPEGTDDTRSMAIRDTVAERAIRESKGKD